MKSNIDAGNKDAITVFSPEAHLIFRSASLILTQQGQFEYREQQNRMDIDMQRPSIEVESSNE